MRLAFLIRRLGFGGAERQLTELAKALHRRGHEVSVLVFYGGGEFSQVLIREGISVIDLGKRGRWSNATFIVSVALSVRKIRPDVLHSYLDTANIICSIFRPIVPNTSIVWGIRASLMDMSRYDWLTRAIYYLEPKLAWLSNLIIANSEAGRRQAIERGFPEAMIKVIPNGIDTHWFNPDVTIGASVRNELGIPSSATLIGVIGRLDPMKDHPTFIRAAALVKKAHRNLRFVCVGDGPADYAGALRRLVESLELSELFVWTTSRPDIVAVYNALDILVLPSAFGEGFPNVVAEGMACGVPAVVTDVGDSRKIVGNCGEIVHPGSVGELAQAIGRMIVRIRSRDFDSVPLSEACRRRIVEKFSVEKLAANTETVLEEILAQRMRV